MVLLSSENTPELFTPIQIGDITLKHRVALAPLTRCRANKDHVHGELAKEYYAQRATTPGTLLITEATFIAAQAGGLSNVPGIWSPAQIQAWKDVVDAVHANNSFIFLQIWALGRSANPNQLASEDPTFPYISSSDVQVSTNKNGAIPRPLTIEEIKEYVQLYATAASNAVHGAGFDGVEIHGANGYLIDQFTQDVCNKRTDDYGGSIENRTRFALEVVEAVTNAVGEKKTAIRLSPWSRFQEMRMSDPVPTFSHLVTVIRDRFPSLGYIHVVEPRIDGGSMDVDRPLEPGESNDFIREIWAPRPIVSAGGASVPACTAEGLLEFAERTGDVIAVGRYFISNPDLPVRIQKGIPWNPYNRGTFFIAESPEGYIDQPFAEKPSYSL